MRAADELRGPAPRGRPQAPSRGRPQAARDLHARPVPPRYAKELPQSVPRPPTPRPSRSRQQRSLRLRPSMRRKDLPRRRLVPRRTAADGALLSRGRRADFDAERPGSGTRPDAKGGAGVLVAVLTEKIGGEESD